MNETINSCITNHIERKTRITALNEKLYAQLKGDDVDWAGGKGKAVRLPLRIEKPSCIPSKLLSTHLHEKEASAGWVA
jgi:hypothetical protein